MIEILVLAIFYEHYRIFSAYVFSHINHQKTVYIKRKVDKEKQQQQSITSESCCSTMLLYSSVTGCSSGPSAVNTWLAEPRT